MHKPAGGDRHFRSAVYGSWRAGPLAVEVMGSLELNGPAGWRKLVPRTRERIMLGHVALFVPESAELIAILHRFGRPKDLRRAALLAQPAASSR